MKHLMIIAGWMLLLFVPMSSALHIDESVNEVLLLGVDCNGKVAQTKQRQQSYFFSVLIFELI